MEKHKNDFDFVYLDPRMDAGLSLPNGFEPDLSFFTDEYYRLTAYERFVLKTYDMSTIYQPQYVVGFGGEHDFDPENVLFNQTANALDYFINLVGDDTHKAILIVEGEERHVPVSLSDKHIFAMHGEIGMAEAIAKRAGIRVVGAEPLPGLDVLAQKYSSKEVFHYLSLRLLPQWYLIDSKYRNPPNVYIASVFRNRPHLERLKYLADVDDYVQALLREDYFSLPYGVSMPDRFECLKQTTYEFIATIPKEDRTITQHIAFEHNLQRDRRLYYDITRYLHEGYM